MSGRTDAEIKQRMCEILEDASACVEANREWADDVKANWQKTLDNAEKARRCVFPRCGRAVTTFD